MSEVACGADSCLQTEFDKIPIKIVGGMFDLTVFLVIFINEQFQNSSEPKIFTVWYVCNTEKQATMNIAF